MNKSARKGTTTEADRRNETIANSSSDEPPPSGGSALRQCTGPTEPQAIKSAPEWHDWRWQMQNRIRTIHDLLNAFPELHGSSDLEHIAAKYPFAITPYYASLIRHADMSDPIFQMSVPQMEELFDPPFLHADPLEEEADMPVPGLIHRYPDRALVMATTMCAMYCRHCTRKRVAGTREDSISAEQLAENHRLPGGQPADQGCDNLGWRSVYALNGRT